MLQTVLENDLPKILSQTGLKSLTVCVVPRAKSESCYKPDQMLFRTTVALAISIDSNLMNGIGFITRHTDTRTTHIRKPIQHFINHGPLPYPGITKDTCKITDNVSGKDILLIDDIYTQSVNIDEDAINALLESGAQSVTFYAVGKTVSSKHT